MNAQTYLFFGGCCQEAIEFYQEALGAKLEFLLLYKDGARDSTPLGFEEKVFHATLKLGETPLNVSDVPVAEHVPFGGFALLVHIESVEDAERSFALLQVGGQVRMPLLQTFWAERYGIVKDRFGVTWKLQVNA